MEKRKRNPKIPVVNVVRCLDLFEQPENKEKSNSQLARLASDFLKLDYVLKKDAIRGWKNKEKIYREQAKEYGRGSYPKLVKRLKNPLNFEFTNDLFRHYDTMGKDLTTEIMVLEARKLAQLPKYKGMKVFGRTAKDGIGPRFIRDQMKVRGWSNKNRRGKRVISKIISKLTYLLFSDDETQDIVFHVKNERLNDEINVLEHSSIRFETQNDSKVDFASMISNEKKIYELGNK